MKEGQIIPLKSIYCERLGFQIGFVNTDRNHVDEQARANACLISAAPDLLGALIALVEEKAGYMRRNNLGDPERETITKLARAAIDKATGVEP